MKKQCACGFCDKIFEDSYTPGRRKVDAIKECFKHEVLYHLNGDEVCKKYIENSLKKLNEEHGTNVTYSEYSFNPYYGEGMYDEDKIEVVFSLKINESNHTISKEFIYKDNRMYIDEDDFYNEISPFYKTELQKEYVGVVKEDPWCGGYGTGDYMIDGSNLGDIMKRLVGKKISIKILD